MRQAGGIPRPLQVAAVRAPRPIVIAWSIVAAVTVLRAVFAARLPLTGDEAYYWEWSRRLAGGYTDHPPAVAFAIAAFAWLGRSPFAVRIAFVLCGIGAAIAGGAAAHTFTGKRRAGAVAALAITLAPLLTIAFGMASPDGPYGFAWALTLFFAARAYRDHRTGWYLALGCALGCALLARFFGLALVAGTIVTALLPAYRPAWRRGFWLSLLVAGALWSPFLVWNAQHGWISFAFALFQRHVPDVRAVRPLVLYALCALAFSPGLWIAATRAAAARTHAVLNWTALPFALFLFVLAVRESVQVYWFDGPFISLAVAFGCTFAKDEAPRRSTLWWTMAPAAALSALVFIAGIVPGTVYAALRASGIRLSDGGPFEMFTYPALARDVGALVRRRDAVAMTDGYGFSSLLDFYGGLTPVVIGYDSQGEEARTWFSSAPGPRRALFVDKVPLAKRPDFERQLHRACRRVVPGPVLSYAFVRGDPRVPPRRYYTTWCDGMTAQSIAVLRWQHA